MLPHPRTMFLFICVICSLSTLATCRLHADTEPGFQQQPIQRLGESSDPFDSTFDDYVEDLLKKCNVPGVSVAVVDNGKILSKGYGMAVLPDTKATADTQYFTASTTKAFTAAAAALLVHNANYPSVQWTSPINSFIREDFVLEDEWATNHITIEDALSHRTGLPGHDLFYGQEGDTVSKVIQRLRYLPMNAEPRVEWQYCNVMYGVVTDLIQTITGRTLESVLREWIWEPLGMHSTTFTVPCPDDTSSKLARGYYWNPNTIQSSSGSLNDGEYIPERHVDLLCTAGDGATISTVNDYALWIKALINAAGDEESWNTSAPICPILFRDLVAPRAIIPVFGQPDSSQTIVPPLYALGWMTTTIGRQALVAHSGGITGFGTELYILPDLNYGLVTMQNRLSPGDDDAGAIIAGRLVLDKLGFTGSRTVEMAAIQKSLLDTRKATRRPARHQRKSPSSNNPLLPLAPEALPLPLPLHDFAGLYIHSAYGTINITVNVTSPYSPSHHLQGLLHPRTNSEKGIFTHISGTLFSVKSFEPHGLGDIVTGEGIVWEELGDDDWEAYAVFEFGADGERVDKLGIELDPDMIETVRKNGSRNWREAMIWFTRVP